MEGFGVPTLQLRCFPISREVCVLFSSPSSRFGFPGMRSPGCAAPTPAAHPPASLQLQPQHPHAPVPPPPQIPFLPGERQKQYQERK